MTLPSNPTCTVSSGLSAVSCVKSGYIVTATLTFSSGTLASGSSFAFNIASVVNPTSTKTSSAFSNIYTTDSSSSYISQYTSSIYIQTTTAATITTASLV